MFSLRTSAFPHAHLRVRLSPALKPVLERTLPLMQSKATTVEQYLASLPDDRRAALTAIRKVILANLDRGPDGKSGFTEAMQYGMIGYAVPHSVFPPGYHCDPKQPLPYAGLASQKNHMSLYLMCVYGNTDAHSQFQKECSTA